LSKDAKAIMANASFRLHFAIGELDIAASREELGYDKITVKNIVRKIEKMTKEIESSHQIEIDKKETKFLAMQYITKNVDSRYSKHFKFTYNNENITNSVELQNTTIVKYFINHRNKLSRKEHSFISKDTFYIPAECKFVLISDGKKTKAVSAARSIVEKDIPVYLISNVSTIYDLGNPEYIKSEDIVVEKTKKVSSYKPGKVFKRMPTSQYTSFYIENYRNSDELSIDIDKDIYYFKIYSGAQTHNFSYKTYSLCLELGIIKSDYQIFGIKESFIGTKKFNTLKTIDIVELMKEELSKSKKLLSYKEVVENKYVLSTLENVGGTFHKIAEENDLPYGSLIKEFKNFYIETTKRRKSLMIKCDSHLLSLIEYAYANLNITYNRNIKNYSKLLNEKYPMVKYIRYSDNESIKDSIKYIKMIDSNISIEANVTNTTEKEIENEAI